MKSFGYIRLLAVVVMAMGFVPKAAMAGAAMPIASVAILNGAEFGGMSPIIKVRRGGRLKVRPAARRRPGAHRPNFNRPHDRRKWRGRRWGARIGGIIVGTAIGVAIAGQVPPRPADGLCWTWSDGARSSGYWYDC
jgi:hypothetical protein